MAKNVLAAAKKLFLISLIVSLTGIVGCRHNLKDFWSFAHLEKYFNTFDNDLYEFHMDVDFILMGVDNYTDYINEVDW